MEVKHGKTVTFRWSEVQNLLPERIAHYGYVVGEIIGNNPLEFRVGDDVIRLVRDNESVSVVVIPHKFHSFESLSSLVAECESILRTATNEGVFRDLEIAVIVAMQLQSYFLRLIREELNRAGLKK